MLTDSRVVPDTKTMHDTLSDAVIAVANMWLNHPDARNSLPINNAVIVGLVGGLGRVMKSLPTHTDKDFLAGTIDGINLLLRHEVGLLSEDDVLKAVLSSLGELSNPSSNAA